MKKILIVVTAAFFGAIAGLAFFSLLSNTGDKHTQTLPQEEKLPAQFTNTVTIPPQSLPDFTQAADRTVHAVVHIKTEYKRKNSMYDYFFDWRDFFGDPRSEREEPIYRGAGSGVIISEDGYIVSNNHVVEGADRIEVTLNDKRTYEATIIGTDPSTDLALIKIEENSLPYVVYGNSDDLQIGEWVLAVGNPFNLTSTVTAGIVSAKARNINILRSPNNTSAIESFIQTDAAVNRGNSGGALVNTLGELVGINAAIASGTGYYAGYSFAIPVNIVRKVVEDLKDFGEVQRALIGVQIRDVDNVLADEIGLDRIEGVYVAGVTDNGSAKEAGIKEGDVIVNINGNKINSTSELLEVVGQKRPGDVIEVAVNRNNDIRSYEIVLKNASGTTELIAKSENDIISILGATFEPVGENTQSRLGIEYGLQITDLENGKLREAGIREDFIITRVDRKPIRNTDDLKNALKNVSGGVLIEGVYPNGIRAYYGVGL